jgi:hypothetical protein
MFFPTQEYFAGMDCPFANASLLSSMDMSASVLSDVGVAFDVHDETMRVNSKQKRDIRFIRVLPSWIVSPQSTRRP